MKIILLCSLGSVIGFAALCIALAVGLVGGIGQLFGVLCVGIALCAVVGYAAGVVRPRTWPR